jgi:hypothetical protein
MTPPPNDDDRYTTAVVWCFFLLAILMLAYSLPVAWRLEEAGFDLQHCKWHGLMW